MASRSLCKVTKYTGKRRRSQGNSKVPPFTGKRRRSQGNPKGAMKRRASQNLDDEATIDEMLRKIEATIDEKIGERIGQIGEQIDKKLDKVEQSILKQITSSQTRSASFTDPSNYGRKIRSELLPADVCIIPRPLSGETADQILPSYEKCLKKKAGPRILQLDFIKWMEHINLQLCKFSVKFTGNEHVPGKATKQADFTIFLKGMPVIPAYTGALLFLLSHEGKFNADKVIGEAISRAEAFICEWRTIIVVGVTNGIQVEWFVVGNSYKASPVYSLRESLCGFLTADASTLYLPPCDLPGVAMTTQLGTGRTSSVYKADRNGQEVAVKMYKKGFEFALDHESDVLTQLQGIQCIPKLVEENAAQHYLLMTPVGKSLASKSLASETPVKGWPQIFTTLVECLRLVHEKGIIHRDIRPSNILYVEEEPNIVLIDWGFSAPVGKEAIFSGAVETGSDNLLTQLSKLQNSSNLFHSECTSVGGDGASGSEGVLTKDKVQLAETSVGGDGASGGVLTRLKAKLVGTSVGGGGASGYEGVLTIDKVQLAKTSVGHDGASGGVLTRGKAKLAGTFVGGGGASGKAKLAGTSVGEGGASKSEKKGVLLGPEDDLVSLVRTLMLLINSKAKEEVRKIPRDHYESYLKSWKAIMEIRPMWKDGQEKAERREYTGVIEFLKEVAKIVN